MNPSSSTTPGSSDSRKRRVMTVATHPAASVATAPIERRAIIIGSVNVIASATLAYAGHALRRITPATVASATQTTSPATTPTTLLTILNLANGLFSGGF